MKTLTRFAATAGAAALAVLAGPQAAGDDIDLLRFGAADPYVMVILDTSASMCLDLKGQPVDADCDDPRSRLYLAKQALYDAFVGVDGVQFGLASYNQDQLRVTNKHWLYYAEPTRNTLPNGWPLAWPTMDGDGIEVGGLVDIDGDMINFGALPASPLLDSAGKTWATCDRPIDFKTERRNLDRYPKLGNGGLTTTTLWVVSSNTKYRLTFTNPLALDKPGSALLRLQLKIERLKSNATCTAQNFDQNWTAAFTLTRWRDFLMWDDTATGVYLVPGMTQSKNAEATDGTGWYWHDAEGTYSCGVKKPFSGKGMEGNYDSDSSPASAPLAYDRYCPGGLGTCSNLKWQTVYDASYRELDYGDFLTWHWERSNREDFLARLNPLHADGARGFGQAQHLANDPDPPTGVLAPLNAARRPLIGGGISPLSDATLDYRCWYLSSATDNKCPDAAAPYYTKGFETIANQSDAAWTCRRPYLILVTDGENNCTGENVAADVANLFTKTRTQTWVVNLGGNLTGVVNNGKGEEVFVDTEEQLRDEMRQIVGTIEQEKRAFASAAVPSVQADVADKIYLTQFTPLNGQSVWPAKVDAYLKPLPIDPVTHQPDAAHPNHLWDAATVLRSEQAPKPAAVSLPLDNSELKIGGANQQRRVYYPLDPAATTGVPLTRRLFDPVAGTGVAANDLREDLWRGLGLVDSAFELGAANTVSPTMSAEETKAQNLLKNFYQTRTVTYRPDPKVTTTVTVEYVMGDVFHANPQVIGGPQNSIYFAQDFPGYRKFAQEQQNRRKILLVGSNDGLLHAFDAGQFLVKTNGTRTFGEFSDGTGREVFAYAPRALMSTIAKLAGDTQRLWGVDGNAAVADVYVDPKHGGTPDATQREWRTVVISGLRQGGRALFALDITQPDPLKLDAKLQRYVPTFNPVSLSTTEAAATAAGCAETLGGSGEVPCDSELKYPTPLWEFTDRGDEDHNGAVDLGETWSTPNVGAIPVAVADGLGGTRVEKRFVAIFGGGYDATGGSGNFLYMVDIETGKILYKEPLQGSAAAEPAAVDLDQDGLIDRIYIGTTGGYLYRVDTKTPGVPTAGFGPGGTEKRVTNADWRPYVLFDTLSSGVRRPIYFRPSVIFVAKLGLYAIGFGTGQRDNLWTFAAAGGERFYTLVDDSADAPGISLPYDEADLLPIRLTDTSALGANYLEDRVAGQRGWYLILDASRNERLVTPPLTLSGLLFFSTYSPFLESTPDPAEPKLTVCEKRGDSRSYSVFAFNGSGAGFDATGKWVRYKDIDDVFVSEPFVEQYQTGNSGTSSTASPLPGNFNFGKLMDELKTQLFSPRCHFNPAYRFDIRTVRSDTGVEYLGSVPLCLLPSNWRPEE